MKNIKIAIIGGGSSGLFLANMLKDYDCNIFILEKNNKLGKKILASGNGKCNFTNIGDFTNKYNNSFANEIINNYRVEDTLNFFSKIGLVYKNDEQGRCYPVSECSVSILDCLKQGLKKVNILLDSEVKSINKKNDGYLIGYNQKKEFFDYVVCCSGSIASNLGSNKAYQYLKDLNINIKELSPSLVPVKVKENVQSLKGVRVKCLVKLFDENNALIYTENGEVLFKEDSLSGIAVFNVSNYINRKKGMYKISLDLSSGMNHEQLFNYFNDKLANNYDIFKGFFNDKIADYIINISKINSIIKIEEKIETLIKYINNLTFNVDGLYGFIDSQVCSGGISLNEVTKKLELKKYPNIYIAGELLDIDGICGGYNLQFAWSSAGVIANEIKNKIKDK